MTVSEQQHAVVVDELTAQIGALSQKSAHWRAVAAEVATVLDEYRSRFGDLADAEVVDLTAEDTEE